MRITQKQLIIRYLQDINQWEPAYRLRGLNTKFGFLGHQADRRARELAQEGKIEHKIEGGYAWYRGRQIEYEYFHVKDSLTGEIIKTVRYPKKQTNLI